MVAYINGERYENNGGRLTVCCSPMGLFGSARWRLQTHAEFAAMVKSHRGYIVSQ
jgi:hypothetical protein